MSKKNLEGENDENETRKKYTSLTGFYEKTTPQRLKHLEEVKHKGDWRRCKRIRVPFKLFKIIWEKKLRNEDRDKSEIFAINTVPTGMIWLMRKLQEAAVRSYQSVLVSVREHFNVSKENFKSKEFTFETMFENNEQYDFFYHLFCKFYNKPSLKKIWEKYPDKLLEERSVRTSMLKWDELGLSWMNIKILGFILPNIETHTVVINAKRFSLHPETDFNQVYEISTVSCFFETLWNSQPDMAFKFYTILVLKVFLLNKYLRFMFLFVFWNIGEIFLLIFTI